MQKRIVHISAHPPALFVGLVAALYSFASLAPVIFPFLRFIGAEGFGETLGYSLLSTLWQPPLAFVLGYLGAFVVVWSYNLLAKVTGGIRVEFADSAAE